MQLKCATHNPHKLEELKALLGLPNLTLISASELGYLDEPEENGTSYVENALIKARALFRQHGGPVLADDSGLSLDVLDGYPGIYSARFAGVSSPYRDKIEKLWDLLREFPESDWTCHFHCALALIDSKGEEFLFEGKLDGLLIHEIRGENGFGYDPVFYLPERGLTAAELSPEEKNAVSHRGRAVQQLRAWLLEHPHALD